MRSPYPRAANALLTLLAASGAALSPQAALAQADPFAIPETLTAKSVAQADAGPVLAEIVVDGQAKKRMVTLEGRGNAMTIEAADARAAGLPVAEGASGPVKIDTLKLYKWSFDSLRQQLKVALFRQNDGANYRDLTSRSYGPSESRPLTAVRLDYDLTSSVTSSGLRAGGLFNAALVRGNLAIGSLARASTHPGPDAKPFVRLDSQAQFLWEKKGLVATAGDFVSAGSQSQRPVRLGGVKISTDFDLRPDLVTVPLPAFSGSVAVPTTIDLVGANQRFLSHEIEPGDFTVKNIPVQPGRGEITAVLRDSLGRERIETARFYVSRELLAPGRSAYAVNAGFVRRRYGEVNNDYGPFAASAYFRRGLSPTLTLEGSAEWTPKTANAGVRADFTIASFAKATVEARLSRDSDAGTGKLFNLGLESVGPDFGVGIGATLPGATYRDVATRLGDPAPPKRLFANAFYRVGANTQVQVALVRSESRADARLLRPRDRTDTATASLQLPITERIRFYGSADYQRSNGRGNAGIAGGLSIRLGPTRHASLFARRSGDFTVAGATYASDDTRESNFGYRVGAQLTETGHTANASAALRLPMMRIEAEAEEVDGRFAGRASTRGSLLFAGGTVYARSRSESGYVLVRAGDVEGIPVTLENRFVGRTNAKGRLLVEDVPALIPIKVDVDPDQLPSEALVKETEHRIRVPRRAVALVDIDAVRFLPVVRAVVDTLGVPLAAGTPVRAMPSDTMSITGYDGQVEINAGARDERLVVGRAGSACVVDLAPVDLSDDAAPPLVCRPLVIANEGAEPGNVAAKKPGKRGKTVARRDFERGPRWPAKVALSAP